MFEWLKRRKQKPVFFRIATGDKLEQGWYFVLRSEPGSKAVGPFSSEAEALAYWRSEF